MSLLEGFSDYVMDEVGRDVVPGVERISAKFHERRNARRSPFERAVMRLTGMDVKMEQYRSGERFVRAIAAVGGASALRRLWEGPESMPRGDEIAHPEQWLGRVMPELAN
jgi:putative hydrolase